MKNTVKFLLAAAVCCLAFSSAYAQRYYDDRSGNVSSYLDLHIGEGVGPGAKGFGGANVSFLYQFSPEFEFGIGGGLDYIHALALMGGAKKAKDYDYHGELSLPLFVRGRYAIGDSGSYYDHGTHFFIQCDMGYRIGLSAYNTGKQSGIRKNFEKTNAKGFFFEPQLGVAPNRVISFSIGFPFQHYFKNTSAVSVTADDVDADFDTKGAMYMGADIHFMISF